MNFWDLCLVGTVDGGEKSAVAPVDAKDPTIYRVFYSSQLLQDF